MEVLSSKVTLAQQRDAAEICHFILTDYKQRPPCSFSDLEPRVRWFIHHGFCTIAREEIKTGNVVIEGNLQALLLGRPVRNQFHAIDHPFGFDHDANAFYVDLVCTRYKALIYHLSQMMILSVGMKDCLYFTKDKGNMTKVHIMPTKKVINFYAPLSRSTAVL